jgi:hypothetical protein
LCRGSVKHPKHLLNVVRLRLKYYTTD